MRRAALVFLTASIALTAVSCGKYDPPAAQPEAVEATEAVTEDAASGSILDEIDLEDPSSIAALEEQAEDIRERARAAADLTAQPMPEQEIPADWEEITNGKLAVYAPPGLEYKETSAGIFPSFYKSSDKETTVSFWEGNDWSEKEESEIDSFMYSLLPEASEDRTAEAFAALGLDYDGTRASFYKAALSFTSADRTEENAEYFDAAVIAKGMALGYYGEVFHKDDNGRDIYIHSYSSRLYDPRKPEEFDPDYRMIWIGAFADGNTEYTALIKGRTHEEALQIASTARIAG